MFDLHMTEVCVTRSLILFHFDCHCEEYHTLDGEFFNVFYCDVHEVHGKEQD